MRNGKMISVVGVLGLALAMSVQVLASGAQVTASLPATQKTVSSGYKAFVPNEMYGYVYSISEHPIKFQAYGKNGTAGTATLEGAITISPGASSTIKISSPRNLHQITLTGWDVSVATKGCIGYGYITD